MPVLDDGPQHGRAGLPQPGAGGNPGAQRGDRVGGAGEPGPGGGVPLGDGALDQLGEDGLLAVEVEVERAAGDAGGGEDLADGQVGERPLGQQPGGRVQDGLAQLRSGVPGGCGSAAELAAGGLAGPG